MSDDRRARLAAMRAEAAGEGAATAAPTPDPTAAAAAPPVLKFRNYHADAASLPADSHAVVEAAKANLVVVAPARTVVPEGAADEAVLAALAPKKPHADLARDLAPSLAKLERRTQRAIEGLLREQAAAGGEGK